MTTLATALSKAISSNLLSNLPNSLATEFGLESDAVKTFLSDFLSSQLPTKGGKVSARTPSPKGANGKGRLTGYILFSNANRKTVEDAASGEQFFKQRKTGAKDEHGHVVWEDLLDENGQRIPLEKIPFAEVGRRLGPMWNALSAEERADWNRRAEEANTANGLTQGVRATPAPVAAATTKRGGSKKAAAASTAASSTEMKISRHLESKAWVVQGTQFVVQSPKNKAVVGKLRGNKVVSLSAAERQECEANGWAVQANTGAPAKKQAAAKTPAPRTKKAAPVEDEEDHDDAGSGDDDS